MVEIGLYFRMAMTWKQLPPSSFVHDNHFRWESNGIEVLVYQPGEPIRDQPEKYVLDTKWATKVNGIVIDEGVNETLLSETPYLARAAAEPVVAALIHG